MLQLNVLYLTCYEVAVSIVFSIFTIYLSIKAMNKFVLSSPIEDFIRRKHLAGCLISATLVFSVVYVTKGSVKHSVQALQSLVLSHHGFSIKVIGVSFIYFLVFYCLTFFITFFLIYCITLMYRKMMEEIDFDNEVDIKHNVALSAFLAITLLGIIAFVSGPIDNFLGSLVFHEYLDKI